MCCWQACLLRLLLLLLLSFSPAKKEGGPPNTQHRPDRNNERPNARKTWLQGSHRNRQAPVPCKGPSCECPRPANGFYRCGNRQSATSRPGYKGLHSHPSRPAANRVVETWLHSPLSTSRHSKRKGS